MSAFGSRWRGCPNDAVARISSPYHLSRNRRPDFVPSPRGHTRSTIPALGSFQRLTAEPVIPYECFRFTKANTIKFGMDRIQNVIRLPSYDGGRNSENCAFEIASPRAAEITSFNLMRIYPPVVREFGSRQRRDREVVGDFYTDRDIVVRQFRCSVCENFQSTKGKARCRIDQACSFMAPPSRVPSGILGRIPAATDSPTGQVLPRAVFDCAQHVLDFGHTLGAGD